MAKKIIIALFIFFIWVIFLKTDVFAVEIPQNGKAVVIFQKKQLGVAYHDGKELFSFRVLTGDDETPTPTGVYEIKQKRKNYFSRKYKREMPYSLFFIWENHARYALHEADLPSPKETDEYATHGCVNVSMKTAKKLFNWLNEGDMIIICEKRWE